MKFKRKCPCVFSANQDILRFVDIVTKEGATPPDYSAAAPEEWAKLNCPQCHGTGFIVEELNPLNEREVDALLSDFKKKMAVKL